MDLDNFIARLKNLQDTGELFKKWNAVTDELIMLTYPSISLRQCTVLRHIIEVIWDVGFSNASFNEVVFRLSISEKQLFHSRVSIAKTIRQLCEKGILKRVTTTYFIKAPSETTPRESRPSVVLELSDKFRTESMRVMEEVLQSTMSSHFSPLI
jgi:predicted transcriptional regulator